LAIDGFVVNESKIIGLKEEVEEVIVNESVDRSYNDSEVNVSVNNAGEVIAEELEVSFEELDLEVVKEKIVGLDEIIVEEISDEVVLELDESEFGVEVDEEGAKEQGVNYKWGYNVVLKDLRFMSKVEVTSNGEITFLNDHTLVIGGSILSFEDLVDEGYSVRVDRPLLAIDGFVVNESKIIGLKEEVEEVIVNESVDRSYNDSEVNVSVNNAGEVEVIVNETFSKGTEVDETVISSNPTIFSLTTSKSNSSKLTSNSSAITSPVIPISVTLISSVLPISSPAITSPSLTIPPSIKTSLAVSTKSL